MHYYIGNNVFSSEKLNMASNCRIGSGVWAFTALEHRHEKNPKEWARNAS